MNSLVQVIECVGDADCHLHSSLTGQFFNSCISLFPKRLRVVLIRQTRNIPLLENRGFKMKKSELQNRINTVCTTCLKYPLALWLNQITVLP